jgi:hypothetical protein
MLHQGHDSAPGLDIMVLKLQFISVSAQPADPARQHPPIEFASTTIMTLLTHFSSTVAGRFNRSDEDIPLDLVFFSPFEELRLRTAGIIESKGIHRVYEPSPVPTLYVGRVEDLLGRVPLIPCFLDGNATSTIPHKYSSRQQDAFEYGCADGAGPTSRRGSHVYEINTWLWNFGRPQPRVGGLSVAKTEKIRRKSRSEASKRGWATKKARK